MWLQPTRLSPADAVASRYHFFVMLTFAGSRIRFALYGVTAGLFVVVSAVATGQSPAQAPSEKNLFTETPAGWKAPRTAWGDPDLQGTWPIMNF